MNSSVRSFLKAQAHSLKPIVMVGKNGLEERVIAAKDEIRPLAEELAVKTGSELVGIIGFIATLYRESEDHLIHIPKDLLKKGE